MKKVIILNGVARSGKDTFADFIIELTGGYAEKISTVDRIKEISKECFGVGEEKTDKERRLWSDLKDAWTRYNDGPFNEITKYIDEFYDGIFLVMCREPAEIEKFKVKYGDNCITTLIIQQGLEVPDNHADQNVANYCYDEIIINDQDKESLKQKARLFMLEQIIAEQISA